MVDRLERIYTVPLGDAYEATRNKRAPRAVKLLRQFVSKHMKAKEDAVSLSENLNMFIWQRSIQKPPRRVKVRLIKEGEGVNAYLADEKIEEAKAQEKKPEAKAAEKKAEEKKEEAKAPEKKPEPKKEAEAPKAEKPKAAPKEEKKKNDQD